MDRKDWMLLLIAEAGEQGLSPVQLQKGLFLLGQEHSKWTGDDYYSFEPYNYGPFDRSVYLDADELEEASLIEAKRSPGRHWPTYAPTAKGFSNAKDLATETPPEAAAWIDDTIAWMRRYGFSGLVRAIYEKYPDYKVNSVFQTA